MIRAATLLGSFLVTFALLIVGFTMISGRPLFGPPVAPPTASSSPVPTLAALQTSAPTAAPTTPPTPSATASPTATPFPLPSPSPAPFRTPPPSLGQQPSGSPSGSQEFALTGAEFTSSDVPEGGQLTRNGDLAVLRTTSDSLDALWVTYRLDPALLPPGTTIYSVDTLICGRGSGDFWEVYGPTGSEPDEYEVTAPEADGCWHFTGAPGDDVSAIAAVMIESQLIVERVVFTVHTTQ